MTLPASLLPSLLYSSSISISISIAISISIVAILISQRTINPYDYSPLCCNPVAISIEAKSPNGSKENDEVQLSVSEIAYLNRLRTLTQDPVSIKLPLVLVSDEYWKLMFAWDLENSIEIIDAVDFGDTGDITGCYKILAALRLLCEWAEEIFLGWFSDRVLKPERNETIVKVQA
ncbi:hypothetical protein BCR34DRAFT_620414 [Clohesyomyces aquaticus]|uniref:PD-(D/E)XK nuclease-like domain-containing protein n=1 Tax=Clohesyomyces aquaticus TaxID=1231657 RepID=A0A1Y1Y518_9PLEO|nr:hypothetical protein BCR34DRAFT_620414 [Clohesyomyces aquaticus]